MDRETAWAKLTEWTEGDSLRRHARAVEIAMRAAAIKYGARQGAVGLRRADRIHRCMLSDSPSGRNDTDGKVGKEELKDKRFAASVEREEVYAGAEKLRVDLTEHITFLIHALVPHAEELHIQGRGP